MPTRHYPSLFLLALLVSPALFAGSPRSPIVRQTAQAEAVAPPSAVPNGTSPPTPAPVSLPSARYYLTAGDEGTNWILQGATATSFAQAHPEDNGEYAIAVSNFVRTLGNGNQAGGGTPHPGSEYSLAGVFTGTTFPYPLSDPTFYDGATDGFYNYSVDYEGGGVYRFSSTWTNPTLLFNTSSGYLGISFDRIAQTLWIARFEGTGTVEQRSLSGALLSSFDLSFSEISCLAVDPADGTLWLGTQLNKGSFYHYTRTGSLIGVATYSALVSQNTLGGEFVIAATTPATEIVGDGAITASGGPATFSIHVTRTKNGKAKGSFSYNDGAAHFSFRSTQFSSISINGNQGQFSGTVKIGKKNKTFTVNVSDNAQFNIPDTFSLSVSNGYAASGNVTSGDISLR